MSSELREKLLGLARTAHTSDPSELARLAKAAGIDCSAEELAAIVVELPRELDEDELDAVAGGRAAGYDLSQNVKL
jgi:predicted ribosomally synthesized peptide with nif11-like leader